MRVPNNFNEFLIISSKICPYLYFISNKFTFDPRIID